MRFVEVFNPLLIEVLQKLPTKTLEHTICGQINCGKSVK